MSVTKSESPYEENLEHLKKLFYFKNVVSFTIKQIQCSAGSSIGDNYMSVVKRVHVCDSDNDSEKEPHNGQEIRVCSVIVKRQIPSLSRRQLYRCDEAFTNEINAYKHIVPLLGQFSTTQLFPKCFIADMDDMGDQSEPIIVMEDLKQLGFNMHSRLESLEISYCKLVMKQLAKLHAASIAAKQLQGELFDAKCKHIKEIVYCDEAEEFYGNILETSLQEAIASLTESNVDGCLTEPIRLIENLQSKLFSMIKNWIVNSKETMNVICHGDLWVNNIMFKTTTEAPTKDQKTQNISKKVMFFDLQAMRYTSPVFDILHFLYTSTKRDLREAYATTLLEVYSKALDSNLEVHLNDYRSNEQIAAIRKTFSLRNIIDEYNKHVLYGLAICMWILPAVTFDPDNIPNLDAISEMNTNAKQIKCTQKLTPEYHLRIKELALEFYQNGYLNSSQ